MSSFGSCGYYDNSRGIIAVNEDHLKNSKDCHYLNYIVSDTVIHEGYHSFQHRAVDNNELAKQNENVDKWKEIIVVYYQSSEEHLYRFQPLEHDTNDYSNDELKKIYEQLENKFGKDKNYE